MKHLRLPIVLALLAVAALTTPRACRSADPDVGKRASGLPGYASVRCTWTYDPEARRYTYAYSVTVPATSPNHLRTIALRPAAKPDSCISPLHWRCFRGWMGDSTAIVWAALPRDSTPSNWDYQPFVSEVHIAPGETLGGFQLVSEYPPDSTAQFIAQGLDTIPGGAHSLNPPLMNRTIWELGWLDAAIVPKHPNPNVEVWPRRPEVVFYPTRLDSIRGSVHMSFTLPRAERAELSIQDMEGRTVAVPLREFRRAGRLGLEWRGLDQAGNRVPGGAYFYVLKFDGVPQGDRRIVMLP